MFLLTGQFWAHVNLLLYINGIGDCLNGNLGLFAADSVLYGVVDNIQDAKALHSDLNELCL